MIGKFFKPLFFFFSANYSYTNLVILTSQILSTFIIILPMSFPKVNQTQLPRKMLNKNQQIQVMSRINSPMKIMTIMILKELYKLSKKTMKEVHQVATNQIKPNPKSLKIVSCKGPKNPPIQSNPQSFI